MSQAILIHDDACGRVYVYVEGALALAASKDDPSWQDAVADLLDTVDEAVESEGSVEGCGSPPPELGAWSGLEPVERLGDDSLGAIIEAYTLGCIATLVFSDEFIFGEDLFFPDDIPGW